MAYNNNTYDFDYDIEVLIVDSNTGEKVAKFNAREYSPMVNDANFEAGGIASGGHNYSVATNAKIYDRIEAFKQQAIIDGVEYKVMSKAIARTGIKAQFCKKKKRETVIYLG